VKAAREEWFDAQNDLDPERLIFIDESGLSTNMARLRGWARNGERCGAAIPHGHWKTITFVGGLTLAGFIAPVLLDGPVNGECFLAWIEQILAPTLRPGHIAIMDKSARPQGGRCPQSYRSARRQASVSAALQSGPQANRKRLRQTQGLCANGRSKNRGCPRNSRRQRTPAIQTRRMPKLLRSRWVWD